MPEGESALLTLPESRCRISPAIMIVSTASAFGLLDTDLARKGQSSQGPDQEDVRHTADSERDILIRIAWPIRGRHNMFRSAAVMFRPAEHPDFQSSKAHRGGQGA
jgi:hypothetical protein